MLRRALHTTSRLGKEPTHKPQKTPKKDAPRDNDAPQRSVSDRDREIHERLMDREGGHHAVGIVDGKYEGGLGKETKKNMFRLI
ncbi:hypothetical protein GLX27_002319 [Malassezia furfur]|uniref:Uncharacterized protein n=1 Tax=Malassezia furfur TaxID=55194 RepID=A0ABY8EQ82_MALFU|nr:hypothetical protein CBS14141_000233 [Malassezia furfur]WFD47667.1 hypothetical protein GLX27_002319 [Malassezia furfur]